MTGQRRRRRPAGYIMASQRNGTLYVGVTSDPVQRSSQHRSGAEAGFAARHGCTCLVHVELYETMNAAIAREKQLKGGSRARKLAAQLRCSHHDGAMSP
jgi:predicted GIY-YIG superfamily endonuclease